MAFSGKMDTLKKPFIDSLTKYDDQSAITTDKALVEAWDSFQLDVSKNVIASRPGFRAFTNIFQPHYFLSMPNKVKHNEMKIWM